MCHVNSPFNEYSRSFRVSKDSQKSFCALCVLQSAQQARVKWRVSSFCYLFCSYARFFFLRFFADSTIKFDFVLTPRVLRKKGGVFFFCVDEIKRTNAPFRKRCVIRAAFLGRRAFISIVF